MNRSYIKIFFCLMIVISVAGCADTSQSQSIDTSQSSKGENEEMDIGKYVMDLFYDTICLGG